MIMEVSVKSLRLMDLPTSLALESAGEKSPCANFAKAILRMVHGTSGLLGFSIVQIALSVICLLVVKPAIAQASDSYCAGYPGIPELTFCSNTPIGACSAYKTGSGLSDVTYSVLPFGGQGNLGDDELIVGTACAAEWDDPPSFMDQREVYRLWSNSGDTIGKVFKQNGCQNVVGNPCNPGTGNKFHFEADYSSTATELSFERSYNSLLSQSGDIGFGWSSNLHKYIEVSPVGNSVLVMRKSGQGLPFNRLASGFWQGDSDTSISLSEDASGYWLQNQDGSRERYSESGQLQAEIDISGRTTAYSYTNGKLVSVIGPYGHEVSFSYDIAGNVASFIDPSGGTYSYTYDGHRNLARVTYPDGGAKIYLYENSSLPNHLTGISYVDVLGQTIRYATYDYDEQGRAVTSEHAGGADRIDLVYNADGTTTINSLIAVNMSVINSQNVSFTTIEGIKKPTQIQGGFCDSCGEQASSYTYDINGNVSSKTNFNGIVTTYVYELSRNLETSRSEAYGTPRARTTSTTWHSSFRLPMQIDEPNRRTTYTRDANGNALTKTTTDLVTNQVRTWVYTYSSNGQVMTVDGPRADVADTTTYTYYTCTHGYECGQVATMTNALGQVTHYNTYNAHGQPLTIVGPNGVVTRLVYDVRQRLTSRRAGNETTAFAYWPTGLLQQVTLPDGSYLAYTYDAAHRLTQIQDAEGNRVVYTLDAMGNHTAENFYDPSGALARTHSRVYNSLNRLWKDIDAAGTTAVTTTYGYDNNGNQTTINAPLTRNTAHQYDELDRLTQITDPANGVTHYTYDASDNLTSVTDPKGLVTTYQYSGLGDLLQQSSPDSGVTQYTYDVAGNVATRTDARGQTATHSYDALNRVTQVQYSDHTQTFSYDNCLNGIGRLCGLSDAGTTAYEYDPQGRVTRKTQSQVKPDYGTFTREVQYVYTNGRMTRLRMPSGVNVFYDYDVAGRISALRMDWMDGGSGSTPILSNVLYDPSGAVRGWTWANGTLAVREYDLDGRLSTLDSAGLSTYSHDAAGRITGISTDGSSPAWTYSGYDALDRLTAASRSGLSRSYSYDANGNRLSQGGTYPDTYEYSADSNQLLHIGGSIWRNYNYDAAGNVLRDNVNVYSYDGAGRMAGNMAIYGYNGLGQRISKRHWSTNFYLYDESGHLLEECDAWTYNRCDQFSSPQYIWLNDIPVATILETVIYNWEGYMDQYYPELFNVHTDHLNTPRKLTRSNASNTVVWRWDPDPFGVGMANGHLASGDHLYVFNLRYPGQHYDGETGLNYNYYRDGYDSSTGRYTQSDPIGLAGGSFSTYAYVGGNPISYIDPSGLAIWQVTGVFEVGMVAGVGGGYVNYKLQSPCNSQGKRYTITVQAVGASAGLGLKCKVCWTSPGKVPFGGSFDDHSSEPDPNAFNGPYLAVSAGAQVLGLGGGYGDVLLGRATSGRGSGFSMGAGTIGAELAGTIGTSTVTDVKTEDCECSK